MLHRSTHSQNAPERNPEREKRLLAFANARGAGRGQGRQGGAEEELSPEERQRLEQELQRRLGEAQGAEILRRAGDNPRTREIALRILKQLAEGNADDLVTGTTTTVREALANNEALGRVLYARVEEAVRRGEEPREERREQREAEERQAPAGAQEGGRAQPVSDIEGETRDALGDTTDQREEPPPSFEDLAVQAEKTLDDIKVVLERMEQKEVRDAMEKRGGEPLNIWKDNINFLQSQRISLTELQSLFEKLKYWKEEEGGLDEDTHQALQELFYYHGRGGRREEDNRFQGDALGHWEELTPEQRKEAINDLKRSFSGEFTTWTKVLEGHNDYITKVDEKARQAATAGPEAGGFLQGLGIGLYSYYAWEEAFKQFWEAWKESAHERWRRHGAFLALGIGAAAKHVLPYGGDELEQILTKNIDTKDEEAKDKLLNVLKSRNYTFRQLFDSGGVFDRNLHDPNHARAVLEYAASRGWLYDIHESFLAERKVIFGHSVDHIFPPQWSPQTRKAYFEKLHETNEQGFEEEKKKAHDRIKPLGNVPLFIKALGEEFDKLNFPAALGIIQGAMERGLWGEISPWLATMVGRKLRESPDIRRYIPVMVLDKIGLESMYRTAFTLGNYKTERFAIHSWLKKVSQEDLDAGGSKTLFVLKQGGTLFRAIGFIEEEIIEKSGKSREWWKARTYDVKGLDHLVAQVLAGQTVTLENGKTVTIFSKQYDSYRKGPGLLRFVDPEHALEEDPDYFNYESEQFLGGKKAYFQILKHSNGLFSQEGKSTAFLTKILQRDMQLESLGLKEEQRSFREETQPRLTDYLERSMRDSRCDLFSGYKTNPDIPFPPGTRYQEEVPVFAALMVRGFIDINTMVQAATLPPEKNEWAKGIGLANTLLRQAQKIVGRIGEPPGSEGRVSRALAEADRRRREAEEQQRRAA